MESQQHTDRMDQTLPPDDAAAALGLVSASRARLADRLVTPWWYHPALGLLGGVAVLGHGSGSTALRLLGLVVFAVGCGVLVGSYRRLTGAWANGYRPGPARRYAVAGGLVLGGGIAASAASRAATDSLVAPAALALAVLLATVVLGRRYDDVLRADLRADVEAGP